MNNIIDKFILNFRSFVKEVQNFLKNNVLFVVFVICSVINASLLRFFTVKNYFQISPILGDAAFVIIIGALGLFIKDKKDKSYKFIYYLVWSIIFTLICIINSVYYSNYLSFTSISLIETSLQLVDVTDAVVNNIMEYKDFIYLFQIFTLIFTYNHLKKNGKIKILNTKKNNVSAIRTLIFGLCILGFFISTLSSTDISRLYKQWNREYITMKFGIYIYHANDIVSCFTSKVNTLFGYDESAKNFREFYSSNENEAQVNKYTNIFKDKNVIVIHAESIQQFTMDLSFNGEEVTPNLNKLANEGLYFSNFYAQESVGTSSDTEFTFNTSLLPASSGTVFVSYWNREYVSIPKLLKEQGYYTFSMHGNNGTFWNRNVMHEQLGYDDFYYYNKDFVIDETIGLGLSDKSFFNQAVDKIKSINESHDKFYGVLIMLTNHTPFTDIESYSDYEVDYKYEEYNEETNTTEIVSNEYLEGTKLGSYIKSVHYADQAIGQLMNDLEDAGILDDTIIVIYGDHDAKLKKSEYNYFYNYNPKTDEMLTPDDEGYKEVDYYQYELNRKVPFIIWSKNGLEHKKITKTMGMYDCLPTLGNMLGFKSNYSMGHDIFSINDNIVVFPDGNWLTDKMYYYSQKDEGKVLIDDTISVDYIMENNKKAEKMLSVSDSIIVYDLIKKVNESNLLMEMSG